MLVLSPSIEQYNELNGYKNGTSELIFVKDYSNAWIVGVEVLEDENFSEILDELLRLDIIEYTPFPEEDI
jgi:hypothetical protein